MEHFFAYHSQPVFPWLEDEVPAKQSDFVSFTQHELNDAPAFVGKNVNIKKRMREFLIKSMSRTNEEIHDYSEKERGRRHMLSERMRREKQKHNYMRLHSLLPSGTKRDKHSIILTAFQKVEELKKCRQELERQNSEMNKMLGARVSSGKGSEMEEAKIRINVAYPSSGIDSMLEILKCLKQTSSDIRLIQSKFLPQQFSAVLGIETESGYISMPENGTSVSSRKKKYILLKSVEMQGSFRIMNLHVEVPVDSKEGISMEIERMTASGVTPGVNAMFTIFVVLDKRPRDESLSKFEDIFEFKERGYRGDALMKNAAMERFSLLIKKRDVFQSKESSIIIPFRTKHTPKEKIWVKFHDYEDATRGGNFKNIAANGLLYFVVYESQVQCLCVPNVNSSITY